MPVKKTVRNLLILLLLASNIGCDQISKSIVRQRIDFNDRISVIGKYVTLTKVENSGAFLSLGNSLPRSAYIILMVVLPLAVIGYLLFYLFNKKNIPALLIIGICFVASGGLGNIFDRIIYGHVTDFLHFDFVIFQTGIVNLADISVTAGFIILLYELSSRRRNLSSDK
jgi:signal peptidase II